MESIYYMNPALGAPYGTFGGLVDGIDYYSQTASGYGLMYRAPYNPMEDAYRIALRSLEDSYAREMQNMFQYAPFENFYYRDRKEYEIRGHFERDKNRLYDDFRNAAQRYAYDYANRGYGYGLRQNSWNFPPTDYANQMFPYKYTYQYINSKETTPVATEAKKYIIVDGDLTEPTTHYAEGEDFKPYDTLAEAEKEAQELARDNPDNEFTIYTSVKKYKVAGTPLDTVVFI